MALIADDAADRAQQMLTLTQSLLRAIEGDTALMQARQPLAEETVAEKQRMVNAYRLEMTRIGLEPTLISGAPAPLLAELKAATAALQRALADHESELAAIKAVSEGLVQAMAEEITRQKASARGYGAHGGVAAAPASALAINRTA